MFVLHLQMVQFSPVSSGLFWAEPAAGCFVVLLCGQLEVLGLLILALQQEKPGIWM